MATSPEPRATALYRLLAWASPAFPIGAFSYSHGLEAAVASGAICDRASLQQWIAAIVLRGGGRIDADILRDAYRAARCADSEALADVNRRGLAYRATAELARESAQQGEAFRAAWQNAWMTAAHPNPVSASGEREPEAGLRMSDGVCHPAAFGAAAASAGTEVEDSLLAYLQTFTANLISAGIRLGVVGQTDGQRILAALEPEITAAVTAGIARAPAEFGAATFAADLLSMAHETQYTRLFRS